MKRRLALLLLIALSACATLTAESEQLITVSTNPPGANCVLSHSQGSWTIAQTPGTALVERSFDPLSIECALPGVGAAGVALDSSTRGRAYGNILLGGIPALVDAKTGDGYVYKPDSVTLELRPSPLPAPASNP